ncbi:MAG TPA: DUF1345 domain-containing protein [Steroidobacteraceae bacterium]|nr:DUF1345 domain-containing protein [Steroidobacteraceae bacterium]
MSKLHKVIVPHTRLWIATLAGLVVLVVAPPEWPPLVRALTAWNAAVLLFLVLVYVWMIRLDAKGIHARYEDGDPSAPVILLLISIAALASLVAILALLATVKKVTHEVGLVQVLLASATIVDSWILVATMFALHYANLFYQALEDPPLHFPATTRPIFWDFIYFSFTIAAACQTSDVYTRRASIRRVVTGQTLISFLFNVSILGFAINVSAGLLGG